MTLYETIFARRSVRSYLPEPLDEKTLAEVLAYAENVEQIPGAHADFRIIPHEEMGAGPAPYYLVASSEQNEKEYANIGFVLEKVDLWLQSNGFGSLWYGLSLPKKHLPNDSIVLGFGKTDLPMRKEEEFNRLPLSKIAETDNAVTRAVRLSPSAVNSQPWKIECAENLVSVSYFGRGLMKASLEKKMNKVDVGIASRIAVTALENEGKTASVSIADSSPLSVRIAY